MGTLSVEDIAIRHLPDITPIDGQIVTNNDG
jgi:hypothetical protein